MRMSKIEEMVLIHTRRGLGCRREPVFYLWLGTDEARTQDVTSNNLIIFNPCILRIVDHYRSCHLDSIG